MCHPALSRMEVKGTSWTCLLFSPTILALSTAPLHWFSSSTYHFCSAVAGILLLYNSEAMQDSAVASLPGCVSGVGKQEILSTGSDGSAWTWATCPSANTITKMVLLGEVPSPLPLSSPPRQLQLLYRFSLQSTLLQLREKLPPFTFPPTAPSPFQQRCHPPSHHRVSLTLSRYLKKKIIKKSLGQQKRCLGDREKEVWGR